MRKSQIIVSLALMAMSICGVALAADAEQSAGVVNINTAEAAQLVLLPGVGAKGAQRIIE
ncbi:MAG TPA: helix-hairpin-helix domain-containing protein, partial [Thermoanaerobaculia bacterium]|nr:helix-hairpin-helix domain-containing protein [Thermoanaerobaculia bacterium]